MHSANARATSRPVFSLEMFHVQRRHVTLSGLRGAIKLVSALNGGNATKPGAMDIDAGEA